MDIRYVYFAEIYGFVTIKSRCSLTGRTVGRFPRQEAWGGQRGKTFSPLPWAWICQVPYISLQQEGFSIFKLLSNSYGDAILVEQIIWTLFWFLFQDINPFFAFAFTWDPELDSKFDVGRCAELGDIFHKPTATFSLEFLQSLRVLRSREEGFLWMC